ncbi:hypothetical protein AB6802_15505 [Mesorhizobium sp. RCC_202]|uniref:hypothetical protein n=1 Tax=Mesorhizobium sp. RCC_202 TaxID=3239222 RepID=UPI003526834E
MTIAMLPDGTRLPVIDTTNAAFRVDDNPAALANWRTQIADAPASRPRTAATESLVPMPDLLRRMFATSSPFLDGLATYILKLGPNALPGAFDTEIERRLMSSPNAFSLRVRLQQVANLMASALSDVAGDHPIRLISIGGGTGIEAVNAIIVHASASATMGCRFTIQVLDLEDDGVPFGRAAVAALIRPGGRLAGAVGDFGHARYTWEKPEHLASATGRVDGEFLLASSEGALFEYASDDAILGNLRALRAIGDIGVAGSVIRDDGAGQAMVAHSPFPLHARGLRGLSRLARRVGYRVAAAKEGVATDQFLLAF